ncbi:GntR family transcriptional regulator [Streptomyces sp. ME18-1-4]|nr:GntR family transcriptional regulator [Streptomyces sp. ME18-1-4]
MPRAGTSCRAPRNRRPALGFDQAGRSRPSDRPCCTPRPWRRSLAGIRSGLFPPGSALPAERAPASRLRVSRGSLREELGACRRTPGPGHPDRQWHLIRESCGCGAAP